MKDALLDQQKENNEIGNEQSKTNKLGVTTQKWIQLQEAVNCFMDSSMASKTADKEQAGVRQLLEKKEGMFRMKMMGKRVNYGGRSVISPDPYITTDQIGVPTFMAKKLTFPESVCSFNAERLRQLVRNGSSVHPGANMIEDEETGQQIHLEHMTPEQRDGQAKLLTVGRKIVYRHLKNGDPLLVNRQPTLHKPSIMAHRCRVLPMEQTIRMHYANCNTYNADFDGDEMNIHLPQSYQAHAEAFNIMATHKQYCVPTSGKPIRGLIQDSVVGGVFLTSKDTFFDKEQYNQLVYIGLRELIEMDKIGKIVTLPPTIFKPKAMWTGK
jgi:DNA-directed RNA polymerase I subunit RPA1